MDDEMNRRERNVTTTLSFSLVLGAAVLLRTAFGCAKEGGGFADRGSASSTIVFSFLSV